VQRGRKSVSSTLVQLAPTDTGPRLTAPAILTKSEQTTFAELVQLNPHLVATDVPLLTSFVQATTMAHRLGRKHDDKTVAEWERCVRTMLALGRRLRLLPVNATHPDKLSRQRRDAAERFPPPWADLVEMNETCSRDDEPEPDGDGD
jgi:hypothetical protein